MVESSLLFAITMVYVILISSIYFETCSNHLSTIRWEHKNFYASLVEKFGIPTTVDPDKGGGAIWNLDNLDKHCITLFDKTAESELTVHVTTPIKLFAGINSETVKVSDQGIQKRIAEIIGILPKFISYNAIDETITTRFYNYQIAQYLTMLCMKITTGELNQTNARSMLADTLSNFSKVIDFSESHDYINEYTGVVAEVF